MRKVLFATCLSTLATLAPALAQNSITIPVTQADIKDDAALSTLYGRVVDAAKTLCLQEDNYPVWVPGASRSCEDHAVRAAIGAAHIAPLSAYYAAIKDKRTAPPPSATLALR